jgi:hypothetical protein
MQALKATAQEFQTRLSPCAVSTGAFFRGRVAQVARLFLVAVATKKSIELKGTAKKPRHLGGAFLWVSLGV